jgi:hypothetical protein
LEKEGVVLSVKDITRGLRVEGVGYGLPMTFIRLGGSDNSITEDILRDMLEVTPKRGWVCIQGVDFDPLGMGIGTLVRGISQLQRYSEVETSGIYRDPSWSKSVDRWIVDVTEKPIFNYGSLRSSDTIRLKVDSVTDLTLAESYLLALRQYSSTKYVVIPRTDKALLGEAFKLINQFERTRVFVV